MQNKTFNFPILKFYRLLFSFTNRTLPNIINRKNTLYGGLNPAVTNVIITHGELDPWRAMGIQKNLNRLSPVIIIPGKSTTILVDNCKKRDHKYDLLCCHRKKNKDLTGNICFIPGASHCQDFGPINFEKDSREMIFAKVTIRNAIRSWV